MLLTLALVITVVVLVVVGVLLVGKNKDVRGLLGFHTAPSTIYHDGPYITYLGEQMLVHRGETYEGKPVVLRDELPFSERQALAFSCYTDSAIPTSFEFTLRKNLNIPPVEYDLPERLLAVSDIEGNFYAFQQLLVGNGVIDEDFNWTFGEGHLVLLGDLFDRDINVLPCLWLIYKLEQEAAAQGGWVHFILGNHEEMNLRGDERHLEEKYPWLARELGVNYYELFSNYSELGQWIRTKNSVEKIGNTLFVHGGISYLVEDSKLTLRQINRTVRRYIGMAEVDQEGELLMGNNGPLWYRGYFGGNITQRHIERVLQTYQAEQMVVGHTVVPDIVSLFEGRLYAIDVQQPTRASPGMARALWVEQGTFHVTDQQGQRQAVAAR
ncbi:MAG: metallophosphoesterase [Tunicatimonas sp.]